MKQKIVVLMGGLSGEREISFLTGKACSAALKKKGYQVYEIDPKGNFIQSLKKIKPKAIFNALHGKYGEDGFMQCILETLRIPYTHSGVAASSLAMNKELSKLAFKKNELIVPKYFLLHRNDNENLKKNMLNKNIDFPIVIKPNNEGSSLGVFICRNKEEFKRNYKKIKKNYDKILVEKYIPGREIQVAVMGKKAIGAIELVPKRKFYDYHAKYSSKAKTKHIMPAALTKKKYKEVLHLGLKAHKILNCKGITRSDFRFYKNKFYLLETNTQPGMTKLSLVPEIAKYCNISFENLVAWMIKNASTNR